MTIIVQYGSDRDQEPAERIANYINNNHSTTALSSRATGVDFSDFEGVIVVGGSQANPVYENLVDQGKFQPVKEPIFSPILQTQSAGRVTESVELNGAVVQGIAGWTEQDTEDLVEWYLGQTEEQRDPLTFVGAVIDDFMERVTDQEVEDPTDPISDPADPDYPEEPEDPYDGDRYTFRFSYASEEEVVNEGSLSNLTESAIENKIIEFGWLFPGWDLVDVRVDEGQNTIEVEMLEEGSALVIGVAVVLTTLIGGVSLNWALDEKTKQKKLTQKSLEDSEETLKEIANDPDVDEETREQARNALIELEGKAPEEIGDSGGDSGNGGLLGNTGNLIKWMVILLFLVMIMNQTDMG